jgi:predicted dehydrogenase
MATVALIQRAHSRHRRYYLEALRDLEAVTAVAVVDPEGATVPEARGLVPDKPVRSYASLDALRRAEDVAMAIVTLSGVEAPGAIRPVLEAGVPVLAEKPACVDPDDFARLAETAERARAPLMLALCNRLAPWATDARRIVAAGGIGRLYAARAMVLADQARIWDPRTRDWTFRKAEVGGGHLIWLGIHWLDVLLYLTGDRVTAVQALTANAGGGPIDVEDVATVNLRLAGGALASLVSAYAVAGGNDKQIDVGLWGAEGWLRFDVDRRTLDWHNRGAGMNGAPRRRLGYDSVAGGYTPFVRDCLRASLGEIPPPITGAEGLEVLRIVFAAYAAAETGRTVELAR